MHRVLGVGWAITSDRFSDRLVAERAVEVLHRIRALAPGQTALGEEPTTSNTDEVLRWSGLAGRCPDWLREPAERLAAELLAETPASSGVGLVHGDFHYGNLLFNDDHLVAVLDWEIASLGDPLTDLGCLAVASLRRRYRPEPNPTGDIDIAALDLAAMYGVDADLAAWHVAASCFKYAVIIGYNLQLHRRGKKLDPIYEDLQGTAGGLLEDASIIMRRGLAGY